jgi:glycerol dehydrogenase-like iron-containing ADH family enzyme
MSLEFNESGSCISTMKRGEYIYDANQPCLPPLIFDNRSPSEIINNLIDDATLLVADSYNYPHLPNKSQLILVTNNNFQQISIIHDNYNFSRVIGVGGCVCLDVARMLAKGKKVTLVPTILSTSCISNNGAVIRFPEGSQYVKTEIPEQTIIPLKWMFEVSSRPVINRWSVSGIGDLIANIGGAIDVLALNKETYSIESIQQLSFVTYEALDWIEASFTTWDLEALKRLANFLHRSSLDVIIAGNPDLSAGGEHDWYHALMENSNFMLEEATHGEIVGIGTLIEAYIFGCMINDYSLFNRLVKIFDKVGLPRTFKELAKIGLNRNNMFSAFGKVVKTKPNSILGKFFASINNFSVLDHILA